MRLLDRGFFRDRLARTTRSRNETYGLATMQKRHVRLARRACCSSTTPPSTASAACRRSIDPEVADVVGTLKRRRGGGDELLAYKRGRRWRDVRSADINAYLKEATGEDVSAKDFRTWGATVLAAVALAVSDGAPDTKTARKRAIMRAVKEVAHYLGNTPAVARASYIDPRVFDRYRDGETIDRALVSAAAERPERARRSRARSRTPCSSCWKS